MPRAAAPRGKRKAAASVDPPSATLSDTLQLPKRPHNASSRRVYANAPRAAVSPLLSPKLPLSLSGKDDDQPALEIPSELDSDLLASGLSTSPDHFLSPHKSYRTVDRSSCTLSPMPASPSPFRHSPSSPASVGLTRTPNKRRFSPESDAAFWDLSPLSNNARSQYPPRHHTPRSPMDSPASTSLFRSPHAVTPRRSRLGLTAFSSPSPSRARSLTPSLNVAAADNSLQLPPVLPSPLGEAGGSGDALHQLPTPRTLFLTFPWNSSSRSNSAAAEVLSTPDKRQAGAARHANDSTPSPPHRPAAPLDEQPNTAVEYGEDSVDSLASVFSRTSRSNPLVPMFFSPHRSSSIVSSRTQLRTPSSSHSHASTSSSASKKASFSILASSSPVELSCVALQAAPADSGGSGRARQRLSFAAEEPQQQQLQPIAEASDAVVADEPALKVEVTALVEDIAAHQPLLSTPLRSRMTEFVMADDGLREKPTAEGEAEQRLLFAYRASADGHAPSELFPVSPLINGVLSLRPRSYTFTTRKDGKVNVSSTPPFSRLDRMLISPSSAALFTPPSPSPSTLSNNNCTSAAGAVPNPIPLSAFAPVPLSFSQSEYEEGALSPAPSASLLPQSSGDVISVDGQPVKAKSCNCKKSQCLKLYCECFAHGRACIDCNCSGCHNTDKPEHQPAREKAIAATRERDSNAFYRAAPLQAKAEKLKAMKARAASRVALSSLASLPLVPPSSLASLPLVRINSVMKPDTLADLPTPKPIITSASSPASAPVSASIDLIVVKDEPPSPPAAAPPAAVAAPAVTSAAAAAPTTPPAADNTTTSTAATSPPATSGSSSLPARKGCNCKKSKCLKKYCECFQLGLKCTPKCKCTACQNGNQHHHGHDHDQPPSNDEQAADRADQTATGQEAEDSSGGGKEDRVRGAFMQVNVASHLACTSGDTNGGQATTADSSDTPATSRQTQTPSKLSAWRLFPGGSASSSSSVPPLSNAPPIPVQPLAPFTLPAPFEIFHQLKKEVLCESEAMVQC